MFIILKYAIIQKIDKHIPMKNENTFIMVQKKTFKTKI